MIWTAHPHNDRLKQWYVTAPAPGRGKPVICDHIRTEQQALMIAAAPVLLTALSGILSLAHLIPQPATHDGLQLADALAAARGAVLTATGKSNPNPPPDLLSALHALVLAVDFGTEEELARDLETARRAIQEARKP